MSFGAKILDLALAPNNLELLAVALGQGKVLIININDQSTLFQSNPHTYNTMIYSPNITVNFLTNNYLLSSGRSQNEFCIFNIETQTKIHTLTISSMSHKKISVFGNSILVAGINNPYISLVNITEINDNLMFSSIIDYKLSSNIITAALSGPNRFLVLSKTGVSLYSSVTEDEESKSPAQIISVPIEKELDENSIINKVCDIAQSKMNKVSDKINNLSKLSWVKNSIQDWAKTVSEENQKNVIKSVKLKTKEIFDNSITPGFQTSVNEMVLQVNQNFEAGIKDFNEKDASLLRELEIIHSEYQGKLTLFDDLIKIFTDNCTKHIKQLKESEVTMTQRLNSLESEKKNVGIHEELNLLLAKGEYEAAILKIMSRPRDLFSLLKAMNPLSLLQSKKLSKGTIQNILKKIENFPPTDDQLPEKQAWYETLIYYRDN